MTTRKPHRTTGQHTRRTFLRGTAAGVAGSAAGILLSEVLSAQQTPPARSSGAAVPNGNLVQLSEHLYVYRGPINVGVIRHDDQALLIDCGDASVIHTLQQCGAKRVDRILFTHHHRDQGCGAWVLAQRGAKIVVPESERAYFDNVASYWESPRSRWQIVSQHPHRLMLAESVPVDQTLTDRQEQQWGPAAVTTLATPGHTDGSVSHVVEIDGRRVCFCGDLIYQAGQIWELYSLQKGFQRGKRRIGDYHGFMGARWELAESLRRILEQKPDLLVPSHGQIIEQPAEAVELLLERMETCYDRYVAISALRHYFPELFTKYAGKPGHMQAAPTKPVPDCLRHVGTSWIVVSENKAAFVMDCGSRHVIDRLKKWQDSGEIGPVEGLWITHYHGDHVNAIPQFQKVFQCPCYADRRLAQVVTNPMAWRLPCISPGVARVDHQTEDGQSWQWHELRMTSYYLPGQTLYHGALLVERGDLRMLFVGDSFTPTGIDDYCAQNRNWLGRNVGFDYCIRLIQRLKPTHLFNCHVNEPWEFSPEQLEKMLQNLAEREQLFGQLVPWDHANYGMDESWVRCFPYEQKARPGKSLAIDVVITNHSTRPRRAACRVVLPGRWMPEGRRPSPAIDPEQVATWPSAQVPSKSEKAIRLTVSVPQEAPPGRYVLPVDVAYHDRLLPQFAEAIVVVE